MVTRRLRFFKSQGDRGADRIPRSTGVLRQLGLRRRWEEALRRVQRDAVLWEAVSDRALACASRGMPTADRSRRRIGTEYQVEQEHPLGLHVNLRTISWEGPEARVNLYGEPTFNLPEVSF
jgi:hypothetical protein